MLDDLRYALRGLARAKATTAVLLIGLAVGTGANAALYSILDSLLFRPPAGVHDARTLVQIFTSQFNGGTYGHSSLPDYLDLARTGTSLQSIAAFDDSVLERVELRGWLQRVRITAVSDRYFATLAMTPALGSLPGSETSAPPAAVISHALWMAVGGTADVIGAPIKIGSRDYTVAAVAPARFQGLQLARVSEVWVSLDPSRYARRGDRRLSIVARRSGSARLDDLQEQLARLSGALAERFPETNRGTRSSTDAPRLLSAVPYSRIDPSARAQVILIAFVVMGATGLLLVSACVTAGSLLLARGAARKRELAVKVALGASRGRLVRQIVLESLILSLGGALSGLLLAAWTAAAVPALFAPDEAAQLDTALNRGFVALCVLAAAAAGALFAFAPARHATTTADIAVLRADAAGVAERAGGASFRAFVVIGQVALSTVLLIATGLLVQALAAALQGDFGPGGRGVAIALVRMPGDLKGEPAEGITFQHRVLEEVRKMPGARSAAWVANLPVTRSTSQAFHLDAAAGMVEAVEVDVNIASPGYFQVVRMPVIEGRNFSSKDGALDDPIAIVNDIFARRYFSPTAVGHHVRDAAGTSYEIVGVVRSGRHRTLQEQPEPTIFFPLSQRHLGQLHLVVRTEQEAAPSLQPLEELLTSIDDRVQVNRMMTFEQHLSEALSLDRFATRIVLGCAVAALLLATLGVYGVLADGVRRRTAEIGLRVALGAKRSQVLTLVFGEGIRLAAAGIAGGVLASLLLKRLADTFVHGLPPIDLLSVAAVPAVLAVVVLAAAAVPMIRALRISPTIALRAE